MNFKRFLLLFLMFSFFQGCEKKVETTFGSHCERIKFSAERTLFKSVNDGSFTFQMEEDPDKNSGYLLIGSFSEAEPGENDIFFENDSAEKNFNNTIHLFNRDPDHQEEHYFADSGKIHLEYLYHDSKGKVAFMKGYFFRLVFVNSKGTCKVMERLDFVFY